MKNNQLYSILGSDSDSGTRKKLAPIENQKNAYNLTHFCFWHHSLQKWKDAIIYERYPQEACEVGEYDHLTEVQSDWHLDMYLSPLEKQQPALKYTNFKISTQL